MPAPANLHWTYFYGYFNTPIPVSEKPWFSFDKLDTYTSALLAVRASHYADALQSLLVVPESGRFSLKTTYPGLLVGSGYRHETGSQNELKLGFSFDFTTGLPIIPGSSVKGLLRSVFPGKADQNQLHHRAKTFITYLLMEAVGMDAQEVALLDIEALEAEIFEGQRKITDEPQDMPMAERDIIHDALIGVDNSGNPYPGELFGVDFITPHRNRKNPRMSPFTNPVPIQFLKVLPNVPVTFQFDLRGQKAGLSAEQRKILFTAIIREMGVGAKTRVGYGQLV